MRVSFDCFAAIARDAPHPRHFRQHRDVLGVVDAVQLGVERVRNVDLHIIDVRHRGSPCAVGAARRCARRRGCAAPLTAATPRLARPAGAPRSILGPKSGYSRIGSGSARRRRGMRGLMAERQLLISALIRHAARYHGDVESGLAPRRSARSTATPTQRPSAARGVWRRRCCGSGSDPATGSARWRGTISAISSCITASPASARCATRSTRACSTSRSSISSTTRRTGCCLSRRALFRWSSGCGRNCRRIAASSCSNRPRRACRFSRRMTSWSLPRARTGSTGRNSTNGPPRRCATRRGRPAGRKASSTRTARRYCTPTPCRCRTASRRRAATRSARSCRCSTPAAGACRITRR